jgi:hypothetical protein
MSWNLLIYKPGQINQTGEPLGERDMVAAVFNDAFPGLEWESPSEAALPVERGFRLVLTLGDNTVEDIYTHGGYDHLRQLATLCRQEG